ncbi:MAG: bifunctional cobalt-precorrin-7 (C(5))-methyltransferase/cobalt-precorrin-6B (C(15))-methyltransferase, partial [Deltaproteobacteria bacterium]
MERVEVVGMGVGNADLPQSLLKLMEGADILAGGRRLLEGMRGFGGKRLVIESPVSVILEKIRDAAGSGKRVVVLADGDPGFFGIAISQ